LDVSAGAGSWEIIYNYSKMDSYATKTIRINLIVIAHVGIIT